jgi:hypothetical protein
VRRFFFVGGLFAAALVTTSIHAAEKASPIVTARLAAPYTPITLPQAQHRAGLLAFKGQCKYDSDCGVGWKCCNTSCAHVSTCGK